jgi:hypothetical protein
MGGGMVITLYSEDFQMIQPLLSFWETNLIEVSIRQGKLAVFLKVMTFNGMKRTDLSHNLA